VPKLSDIFLLKEGKKGPEFGKNPRPHMSLYDHFSETFEEFKRMVEQQCAKDFGADFKQIIDQNQGWPGATDWGIQQLWDNLYTDYEAHGEIARWFDVAQRGEKPYGTMALVQGENTLNSRVGGAPELWFFEEDFPQIPRDVYERTRDRLSSGQYFTWVEEMQKMAQSIQDDKPIKSKRRATDGFRDGEE
jgi:hypothetical protein